MPLIPMTSQRENKLSLSLHLMQSLLPNRYWFWTHKRHINILLMPYILLDSSDICVVSYIPFSMANRTGLIKWIRINELFVLYFSYKSHLFWMIFSALHLILFEFCMWQSVIIFASFSLFEDEKRTVWRTNR